jgi:hypothetical protein
MRWSAHWRSAPARTVPPAQRRRVGSGVGREARGMGPVLLLAMAFMWVAGKPDIVAHRPEAASERAEVVAGR